jgi:hypothetical protein
MANSPLRFNQVTTLPGTLTPSTFYFVANGTYAESYLTDAAGVAKSIGNSVMINSLIDTRLADFNATEVVTDIAARNALASGAQRNFTVLVTDATGDDTVASGSAMYVWVETSGTWVKIAEYESMDLVLEWANIQGKPTSTPTQIDEAVSASHTHANKALLDGLSSDSDGLMVNGNYVQSWTTANW